MEDNIDNLVPAKKALEDAGYSVETAGNGREAVEAVRRYRFEVILMDIQMPVMDGCEATRHIREEEKEGHIPIIAFTALNVKENREHYRAVGMDDCISKPFTRKGLIDTVERWIDRRPVILVVDDLEENRRLIAEHLRKKNFKVVCARDGVDAIGVFTKMRVSLVLMDMEMPVMDGYTAARTIRGLQRGAAVPIIAMTAHEGEEEINRCLRAGCIDYLGKPLSTLRLMSAVGRCVSGDVRVDGGGEKGGEADNAVVRVAPDLAELIPGFLENRRREIEEVRRLLAEGNLKEIYRIGHNMKGSGSGYGFDRISELGWNMAEAAQAEDRDTVIRVTDHLAEYLSSVSVVLDDEE